MYMYICVCICIFVRICICICICRCICICQKHIYEYDYVDIVPILNMMIYRNLQKTPKYTSVAKVPRTITAARAQKHIHYTLGLPRRIDKIPKKTFRNICVLLAKVERMPLKLTPERCDTHDHRSRRIKKSGPERKPAGKR